MTSTRLAQQRTAMSKVLHVGNHTWAGGNWATTWQSNSEHAAWPLHGHPIMWQTNHRQSPSRRGLFFDRLRRPQRKHQLLSIVETERSTPSLITQPFPLTQPVPITQVIFGALARAELRHVELRNCALRQGELRHQQRHLSRCGGGQWIFTWRLWWRLRSRYCCWLKVGCVALFARNRRLAWSGCSCLLPLGPFA